MKFNRLALILLLFALAFAAHAQQSYMERADVLEPEKIGHPLNYSAAVEWFGKRSNYCLYVPETENGRKYFLLDLKRGKKTELFEEQQFIEKMDKFLGLPAINKRSRFSRLYPKFDGKNWTKFHICYRGKTLSYDLKNKRISHRIEKSEKTGGFFPELNDKRRYSKDSIFSISAIDHNLYLFRNGGKDSLKISFDGEPDYSFANVKKGEGINLPIGCWIGNSHTYMALRSDKRKVGTLTLVNSLSKPRPVEKTYKFEMPGDENVTQYEIWILNADKGTFRRLTEAEEYKDQEILATRMRRYEVVGNSIYFTRLNRERNKLDLCKIEADGSFKVLIRENCAPHLNEQLFDYRFINCNEILWWSERTGKGKFYLYDSNGRLKKEIGNASQVCAKIEKIDTSARNIIYSAYGGEKGINPNYKFYYSASLDKGIPLLLTSGDGDHSINFSPDGKYIIDSYSRMDMAPKHKICDTKGRLVMELDSCNVNLLLSKGWKYPEVVCVKAADSITDLYGVVYLPLSIEKNKKYPIITNVYPGPQDDQVPQSFSFDDNGNQSLANLGFIVINFSYRGSNPRRGRDFYNFGYGNLRDYATEDVHKVVCEIAKKYKFADINKVGIYGHSGGAFLTVASLLTYPDFFKVGIAASGNHDNNIYTKWWGESFHGVKEITDKNGATRFECKIPTNIEIADRLNSRLLLVTGDMDNNVHPASTLRLAKAFIDKGKRIDMLIMPGAEHEVENKYFLNVVRYYFVENLLGIKQNDINIVSHNL